MFFSIITKMMALFACAAPVADADDQVACHAALSHLDVSSLHGVCPTVERVVPEFSALSHDGSLRAKADLLGTPTVLWFFPMAGTPG